MADEAAHAVCITGLERSYYEFAPNLVASLITIVSWLVWMWGFDKQWSNTEMFALYHGRLDCNRATDSLEEAQCQAAYLLWGSPLILGMLCFFFGIACS